MQGLSRQLEVSVELGVFRADSLVSPKVSTILNLKQTTASLSAISNVKSKNKQCSGRTNTKIVLAVLGLPHHHGLFS
jgi:hypothetical protein